MRIRTMMGRGMRTTTRMVDKSRRRAGLPAARRSSRGNSSSLVNYLMQSGTTAGSGLSAKDANSNLAGKTAKNNAVKLESSSQLLMEQAKLLGEKVDAGSSTAASTASIMVEKFNETLKNLRQVSGVLNDYYRRTMSELTGSNKNALAEAGITVSGDGSMSLDKEKFAEADGEKLKALFGTEGDFMKRLNFVASRVYDNAEASSESTSSRYNASGNVTNSYLSKYNMRG